MTSHGGGAVAYQGGGSRGVGRTELGGVSRGGGSNHCRLPPKALASRFYPIRPMYNFVCVCGGGGGSGQPGNPPGYTLGKGGGVQGGGMGASLGGGARPACIGANLKAALSRAPRSLFFLLVDFCPRTKGAPKGGANSGGGRWRPSGRHLGGGVWGSPQEHF